MKTRLLIFLLAIFSLYSTQNIQAQLSGDYTIGSGDFPHFSAAIDSLNTYGISGDVNFAVQDDTYNEQIIFPEALVYGPHSIYFYAASGQIGQVIMGLAPPSIDNYILKFESGSNITFENIIFQNTNVASDVAGGVILFDNTIFPIVNVNFINCNFIGVPVAEPHDVAENNIVTRDNSAMEPPSNGLLFQNCQFFNGNSALSLRGYESEPDSLTSIEDCYFNNFYADAIHLEFTMNSNISGNEINGKPSAVAFQQGIYAKNCDSLKVNSNKITLNGVNNTGIMSELGYLSTTIANNMVICNAGNINYGIAHNESENIKVYYNSVSINAGMGAAFSDMSMSPLGSDIRNNIFSSQSSEAFAAEYVQGGGTTCDNNIYYAISGEIISESAGKIIYTSLADWTNYSSLDSNSIQAVPHFIAPDNNLHLTNTNPAESNAVPIAEVETDIDGDQRDQDTPDIGADEGNFSPALIADAGEDQINCSSIFFLSANDPSPAVGTWTIASGNAYIHDINNPNTQISDLQPAAITKLIWTVSDGNQTVSDTVSITNLQPNVDAGTDITIFLDDLAGEFPEVMVSGNDPGFNIGSWYESSGSLIFSDDSAPNPTVSNITAGVYTLYWDIFDVPSDCSNIDSMQIIAGYSFVSNPDDGVLDWSNPNDWSLYGTPGNSDSVTVYNCTANVDGIAGESDQLVIGSGSEFNLTGTAKAQGSFVTRGLYIEQSAVKFKGIKGTAVVNITGNSQLNVGAGFFKGSRSVDNSGIYVRSGGELNIRNDVTKGETAKYVSGVNIGSGGGLYIEQSAVKSEANVNIGSGGGLYIEQSAVKSNSKSIGDDVFVGSGGGLYIEQSAVKGKASGQMVLGADRGLYIEQSAVKTKDKAAGGVGVFGGGLYIEQSAVKNSKSVTNGITVGYGGGLYIEQSAVKTPAVVSAPYLNIIDGKVIVGTADKNKALGGNLSFRGLYIEQSAVKGLNSDTALIVNPGASLYLDTTYTIGVPYIEIKENVCISAEDGSHFYTNNGFEDAAMSIESNASFIDKTGDTDSKFGIYKYNFEQGQIDPVCIPLESVNTGDLNASPDVITWSEYDAAWINAAGQTFNTGRSFAVSYPTQDNYQGFLGILNDGTQYIPLYNSDLGATSGWNLTGNPYPSAIDWELLPDNSDIISTAYSYDEVNKTFKVYQKEGISLNGASRYIPSGEAFCMKVLDDANLIFSPSMQVHHTGTPEPTVNDIANYIKLKASGSAGTFDEAAVRFTDDATEGLDPELDALKYMNFEVESMNFYSKSPSSPKPFGINSLPANSDGYVLPLYFESETSGPYTIELIADNLNNNNVSIYLHDNLNPDNDQNLKENPTYNFTHDISNDSQRFELLIGEGLGIENEQENSKITVYSNEKTLYINNLTDKEYKVEIIDLSGKTTLISHISGTGNSRIRTQLKTGIYIVRLSGSENVFNKKVFIK